MIISRTLVCSYFAVAGSILASATMLLLARFCTSVLIIISLLL